MNDNFNLKQFITETRLANLNLQEEEDNEQNNEEVLKAFKAMRRSLLECYDTLNDLEQKKLITTEEYHKMVDSLADVIRVVQYKLD